LIEKAEKEIRNAQKKKRRKRPVFLKEIQDFSIN